MSSNPTSKTAAVRHDWTAEELIALFEQPFFSLLDTARSVHQQHFPDNAVQLSTLLSIKTGACPEDCKYCPQSVHYNTEVEREKLMDTSTVLEAAKAAKAKGATRFCMGAAWRRPTKRQLAAVGDMISAVKAMGLETCVTLGSLSEDQAASLKDHGLDYYNHNLDTSPDYYKEIITTRTYDERLETLENVRSAGINVCCGGIVGMGETRADRVAFLQELIKQQPHPQSVPINQLIAVEGTPMSEQKPMDDFEFIRMIAIARITMPDSYVRLSAGRENMNETMQALCLYAGANSIFYGEKLLTCGNPEENSDLALLTKLGLNAESSATTAEEAA